MQTVLGFNTLSVSLFYDVSTHLDDANIQPRYLVLSEPLVETTRSFAPLEQLDHPSDGSMDLE